MDDRNQLKYDLYENQLKYDLYDFDEFDMFKKFELLFVNLGQKFNNLI